MNTKIFSVFPACGKTWLYNHQEDFDLKFLDSDSSEFSWLIEEVEDPYYVTIGEGEIKPIVHKKKIRNPDFPNNYIKYIKENIGKYDCIFVSSHASVREALDKEGIDFTIVYPMHCCKAEWVGRCFIRELKGENGCSARVMYDNFDNWIAECFETGNNHKEIVLQPTTYLSEYFERW